MKAPFLLAICIFFLYSCVYSQAGDLDSTFDGDGITTVAFSNIFAVVAQPDGKVISAGDSAGTIALARFNNDGSLDPTFSNDGKVTTDIGSGMIRMLYMI